MTVRSRKYTTLLCLRIRPRVDEQARTRRLKACSENGKKTPMTPKMTV